MKRVTGIGGIFIKCKNTVQLKKWYEKHLGFNTDEYGTSFVWHQIESPDSKGYTQWSLFKNESKYFEPSAREFMMNYRVENLTWLIEELKKEGVQVLDEIETFEYGKFVHILDLEGNKVELWEPIDSEFEKIATGKTPSR